MPCWLSLHRVDVHPAASMATPRATWRFEWVPSFLDFHPVIATLEERLQEIQENGGASPPEYGCTSLLPIESLAPHQHAAGSRQQGSPVGDWEPFRLYAAGHGFQRALSFLTALENQNRPCEIELQPGRGPVEGEGKLGAAAASSGRKKISRIVAALRSKPERLPKSADRVSTSSSASPPDSPIGTVGASLAAIDVGERKGEESSKTGRKKILGALRRKRAAAGDLSQASASQSTVESSLVSPENQEGRTPAGSQLPQPAARETIRGEDPLNMDAGNTVTVHEYFMRVSNTKAKAKLKSAIKPEVDATHRSNAAAGEGGPRSQQAEWILGNDSSEWREKFDAELSPVTPSASRCNDGGNVRFMRCFRAVLSGIKSCCLTTGGTSTPLQPQPVREPAL